MNLKLLEVGTYIGPIKKDNQHYINHFKERNKDIGYFFTDILGRKVRRLTDDKNSLTMAFEAVDSVLKKNNLKGQDIDIIIFGSSLPEYLCPTCSILIHRHIEGKEDSFCLDVNIDCAGMVGTLQIVKGLLGSIPQYKRALIVGSDYMNPMFSTENEFCYGAFGDAACAIIVEKTEENSAIIDFSSKTNSSQWDQMIFPPEGLSNVLSREVINKEEILLKYTKPQENFFVGMAVEQINSILKNNNLSIDDIAAVCLSQYTLKLNEQVEKAIGLDPKKSIFIGDCYGYTATTSPFLAFREALRLGRIKRGDYVVFWTIGTGSQGVCCLIRY